MIERFLVPAVIVLGGLCVPTGIVLALLYDDPHWLLLCLFLVFFMA